MADLAYLSITEVHQLLQSGKVSCVELTQYYLDRINQFDKTIMSVLTLCNDSALKAAELVDKKIQNDEKIGVLEGVPYTAKDMFLTQGIRTTAASKILENFTAPYSATVIEKLEQA